jgi:hypothetical protein
MTKKTREGKGGRGVYIQSLIFICGKSRAYMKVWWHAAILFFFIYSYIQ